MKSRGLRHEERWDASRESSVDYVAGVVGFLCSGGFGYTPLTPLKGGIIELIPQGENNRIDPSRGEQ
jgi:hypothetical protein